MEIIEHKDFLEFRSQSPFSAAQTFGCGQCFRWTRQADGSYQGIVRGHIARVWDKDGALCLRVVWDKDEALRYSDMWGDLNERVMWAAFNDLWRNYFDFDTDYVAIRRMFAVDDFTAKAAEFGAGIRILRQDPWEVLCTFLLSQCNNIPRITAMVQRLCAGWGEPIPGTPEYAFPRPEALAFLTPDDLAPLRAGYRAPYLISAAQVFRDWHTWEELAVLSTEEVRRELLRLPGVGRKVADCVLLFGLHRFDAFPVDTWMKKAAAWYDGDMKRFMNSPYAGIYQQYFFHYVRNGLALQNRKGTHH